MARRRALLAGLGTSGLLIVLALLLLAVVGALIAFEGGPAGADIGDSEGVSLDQRRLVSAPAPSFAAAAVPARRAVTARRRRQALRSRSSRLAARQEVAGVRRTLRADGALGDAPSGATPPSPASSSPGPSKPAPAGAENVADAVNGVAGGTQETIGNTTAPVGQLVQDTGSAVTETVRQLGSKVTAGTKP